MELFGASVAGKKSETVGKPWLKTGPSVSSLPDHIKTERMIPQSTSPWTGLHISPKTLTALKQIATLGGSISREDVSEHSQGWRTKQQRLWELPLPPATP